MEKKKMPLTGLAALGEIKKMLPTHTREEQDAARADSLRLATQYIESAIVRLQSRLKKRFSKDADGEVDELYSDEEETEMKNALTQLMGELRELQTNGEMRDAIQQQRYAQQGLRPSR